MLTLAKALIWDSIGSSILNRSNLVSIIKINGRQSFKQRQVLNTFYKYVIQLKDSSALGALDLMELLLKYGDNMLAVDYFFAFIVVNH